MDILDVTQIEPRLKHPSIFKKFDDLSEGDSFIIHNDHDPKPLYYQLIAERGEVFNWQYILSGPKIWEIKITKLNVEKASTIGELVADDYRKAEVFSKFGLDFCCGGKKSLKEACEKKGVDENKVQDAINKIEGRPKDNQHDFNDWEVGFLTDYIINVHHKYVKDSVNMLYKYSDKVAERHGNKHKEVVEISKLFKEIEQELTAHMQKEEAILFPYIKKLDFAKKENIKIESLEFLNVKNPISMMVLEHEIVGEKMDKVHTLSNNFTPPADACSSYQVLYSKLKEFEKDLHQHVHLENNILFPKAIELEKELFS